MESKLILSKNSSENEIKRYFKAVLKLAQSDDEFPINLDEVWPLVYSEKGKAVRALTSNEQFIEGVDYKTLAQNGKQDETSWGGNNKIDYKLTVSCMEFFIARKVRPVFEVYRKVFHKPTEQTLSLSDKMKAASWAAKFLNLMIALNCSWQSRYSIHWVCLPRTIRNPRINYCQPLNYWELTD